MNFKEVQRDRFYTTVQFVGMSAAVMKHSLRLTASRRRRRFARCHAARTGSGVVFGPRQTESSFAPRKYVLSRSERRHLFPKCPHGRRFVRKRLPTPLRETRQAFICRSERQAEGDLRDATECTIAFGLPLNDSRTAGTATGNAGPCCGWFPPRLGGRTRARGSRPRCPDSGRGE
jgi:hypothetical protein